VQVAAATSHVVPQKKDPWSEHGVAAKHTKSPSQSLDSPEGQAWAQVLDALSKLVPQ
jgi:hypothetical protein